ncbi:MAG: hypothetical protein ABSH50_02920 [Bryobacteraceae bacterium]
MSRIALAGFVCLLVVFAASAQVTVEGGGPSLTNIPNGAAIWYAAGAPVNTVGANGDYYVNTSSYCLYGPKASGVWPSTCASSVRQLGYVAEDVGNRGTAGGYAPLDSNGLVPPANLPPITAVNGTTLPGNSASDQTVVTTAPTVGAWAALPACPDTGGNHLNYSVVTHGFLCGNTGGTAGSVNFGGVGNGTNANALLISGTLGYTGGGSVNANQLGGVSLAALPTGLLKITTGTGLPSVATFSDLTNLLGFTPENPGNKGVANGYAPLGASATVPLTNLPTIPYGQLSGVQSSLGFMAENAANKNAVNGYAPLDSNGLVPSANLPPITAVSGTSIPGNSGSDQTVVTTAPAVSAWAALPACPDTGGNHLNYSVVTHGFLCGNTGGTAGSVNFGGVGNGINANALLISGTLGYTGGGSVNANQLSGVSLAALPTGLLKITTGTGLPSVATFSDLTNLLGFTPENLGNKGVANGYAPLGASATVPLTNLPTIPYGQLSGVQASLGFTAENAANKNAANGYAPLDSNKLLPAANLPTSIPLTNLPTIPFAQTSGVQAAIGFTPENAANKGAAGGYAPLDGSTTVPLVNLPTIPYSQTSGVQAALGYSAENTANKGAAGGYAPLGAGSTTVPLVNLPAIPYSQTSGVQAALGYSAENTANKGAANGYAPLNSSQAVPLANLPAIPYSQTSGVQAALGYTAENAANKNQAGGYASLDSGAHLPAANMPALSGDLASVAGSANVNVGTVLGGQTPVTSTSIANATLSAAFTNLQATGSAQFGSGSYQSTISSSFTSNRSWIVPDFSGTMVMNGSVYAAGGGTAQAQTAALPGPLTSYAAGMQVEWLPIAANTASGPTLNVNSLGAVTITKCGGAALAANDVVTTAVAFAVYDGTNLELQNPQAVGCNAPTTAQLPNTTLMTVLAGNANGSTIATGASYIGMGTAGSSTSEAARLLFVPAACTLRSFHLTTTSTNSSGGSIAVTLRVNQAMPSGGPTITINSGDTAQNYADTSHTVTLAAGNNWDLLVQNNGTSSYSGLAGWSIGCFPN